MKKLIFLILVIILYSCSKQTEPYTIVGKWRPIEMMDDVHGERINNSSSYIQFNGNGTLKIHSNGVRNYSFPYLESFNHYIIRSEDYITFYNSAADSIIMWYGVHDHIYLYISYNRYTCDIYMRTP